MTAYAAHLRVYEPLAAFSGTERAFWERYVAAGEAPTAERGVALERAASLRALVGLPPAYVPDLGEHAFVTELDGVVLLCPWRTRLRAWESALDVRAELPDLLADAFVPRAVAEGAEESLEAWRDEHAELRVHLQSSTWQVPARWFVLFDPDEREVRPGAPPPVPGAVLSAMTGPGRRTGRSLVYRTAMSRARRRVARALAVLGAVLDEAAMTAGVEDLGRWLEEFHPRSLVELDYGGLVHLLDDAELTGDESARDVAAALSALGAGQADAAAAAYGRVLVRMKALQAVESAG